MHRLKICAFLIVLLFYLGSCTERKDDYITIVEYVDNTGRQEVRENFFWNISDTLYIFFEGNFRNDTVEVKVGKDKRNLILQTNVILGLSDVLAFGNINEIKEFRISLNGRKEKVVHIKDVRMNKWAVNFYRDTLKINVLKYIPMYE